jgi:hypothetical protein
MGETEPVFSEGLRGLLNSTIICCIEVPMRHLQNTWLGALELPNCRGRSGKVGGLGIQTKEHGPIDILLHANDGFLVEMEVIWYNFPQPFPEAWEEVSRIPDPRAD